MRFWTQLFMDEGQENQLGIIKDDAAILIKTKF